MKVALFYDYLNQLGGGERVLKTFTEIFPDSDLYCLFHSAEKTKNLFQASVRQTSFIDFALTHYNHRPFIPLMPVAAKTIKLKESYDLVISIGASFARAIPVPPNIPHIHYCFTPLRYAWEDSLIPPALTPFKVLTNPIKNYLKNEDYKAAQTPQKIFTISKFIQNKIKTSFNRDSEIIYPPYNETLFYRDPTIPKQNFYLLTSRLLHYKKVDLVIEAFNELGLPLKIIGTGPELSRLKKLAKSNIEFLGFVPDASLNYYYNFAKAFIFPQIEDFGLTPLEAIACHTPVIAYQGGGVMETVHEGETGLFFKDQTKASLIAKVLEFETKPIKILELPTYLQAFQPAIFKENWISVAKEFATQECLS